MARKSAAALAVVPASPDRRLPPPADLSEAERAMWSEIIDTKPADWFDVDSAPVLKEYVRAATMCDRLAEVVERALSGGDEDALKQALDMRDKEARRMTSMGTKLRLTQQSQYNPRAAATANGKATGNRPWQT